MMDHHDREDEYPCCKEAAIVVYHYGIAMGHCYKGTSHLWIDLESRDGYYKCNSSYSLFGAIDE